MIIRLPGRNRPFRFFGIVLSAFFAAAACASDNRVPEGFLVIQLGQSAELAGGGSITVSDFHTDQPVVFETLEGRAAGVAAWFTVKVCAGQLVLEGFTSDPNFSLSRMVKTGHERRLASPHPSAKQPFFATPYVPEAIGSGSCREGWVSVVAGGEETVLESANAILFDPSSLGFVPPAQQVKVAWMIQ